MTRNGSSPVRSAARAAPSFSSCYYAPARKGPAARGFREADLVSIRLLSYLGRAVVALRESDFRAMLDFLREAEAAETSDPFPPPLLESLRRLISCESVNFTELDRQERRTLSETDSTGVRFDRDVDGDLVGEEEVECWRVLDRHPLCLYQARTGRNDAMKISDFYSRRQLHRLELYAERLRPNGTEDELEVGICPSLRYTKNFLFHGARDFDERDRLVLNLLQPHLAYLYRHAADRRALAAALAALNVAGSDDRGVIVLGRFGRVEAATPAAQRLLEEYFNEPLPPNLPEVAAGWLREQTTRQNGDTSLPAPAAPLTIERTGRRLRIVLAADDLLLLDEEPHELHAHDGLELTQREWEVLRHVAKGRSNTQIASTLWIATSTVRKHLEHIYEKLNVSSRTAAVATAFPSVADRTDPRESFLDSDA
jgi:DNA-binding CsgD family transcriptional regulator